MKLFSYLLRNWRRLVLANLLGFALQAAIAGGLILLGAGEFASVVVAKAASWVVFLYQLCTGR